MHELSLIRLTAAQLDNTLWGSALLLLSYLTLVVVVAFL
jgi:hypothetical protein